jgi:hypothetical protein
MPQLSELRNKFTKFLIEFQLEKSILGLFLFCLQEGSLSLNKNHVLFVRSVV